LGPLKRTHTQAKKKKKKVRKFLGEKNSIFYFIFIFKFGNFKKTLKKNYNIKL
jgi:hypothetical protein